MRYRIKMRYRMLQLATGCISLNRPNFLVDTSETTEKGTGYHSSLSKRYDNIYRKLNSVRIENRTYVPPISISDFVN